MVFFLEKRVNYTSAETHNLKGEKPAAGQSLQATTAGWCLREKHVVWEQIAYADGYELAYQ